ncbi:MAG: dihydropyrimidinase [Deltaproteobacteria bacterium]|nr:dihydropyrimidinase [Deltaproteobacteria bacterium]
MRKLIANGTVVTASETFKADVWLNDDKVEAITAPVGTLPKDRVPQFDETIDAKGQFLFPGGIDVHTHLDMPFGGTTSSDDFETGTRAAAYGGTTTIIDFAIQQKGGTLTEALDTWHKKASGKAVADYAFHMIATDLPPARLEEMKRIVDEGVTSFKLFMAYPNVLLLDDQSIFRGMLRAGELGALICMHAETGLPIDVLIERARSRGERAPVYHALTRPEAAEATGTERAIALAEMAKVPVYIVHLSAARALERVREARDRGLPAFAETCPQYLFLSQDDLARPGFDGAAYICTPPLRPQHHHEQLWRGIRNHDLQVVATDHCPFCMKDQKELGRDDFSKVPNGMPGVESRMYLLWEAVQQGKIDLNRFVDISSTTPSKIFGMYGKKGTLAVGADADIVVWDPQKEVTLSVKTMHMKVDYNPYEGKKVRGGPSHVLQRGRVIVKNDQFLARPGDGQFIRRRTHTL